MSQTEKNNYSIKRKQLNNLINYRNSLIETISYSEKTTEGTLPLTFNAKNANLISLVRYGKCVQTNLPLGYTQLEYIESTGTQYIDTGIKLSGNDIIETQFKCVENAGALYGVYGSAENSCFYANDTYYSYDANNNKVDTQVSVDTLSWHYVIHDFPSGLLTLDNTSISFTNNTFNNSVNSNLFARYYSSYGYFFTGMIKKHKITRNGNVILDLIPAIRISDSVIGMYDKVSNNFLTNAGTGTFIAGPDAVPTPDAPMDIVSNNGVLKVSPNLFDGAWEAGIYAPSSGVKANANNRIRSVNKIIVQPATTYTLSLVGATPQARWCFYDENQEFISFASTATATTPDNAHYATIYLAQNYTVATAPLCQIEQGSTASTYMSYGQIYTDGTVETINVHTKNLFDISKVRNTSDVVNNGNGSITVTTGSSSSATGPNAKLSEMAPNLEIGKTYVLSFTTTGRNKMIYLRNNAGVYKTWYTNTSITMNQDLLKASVYFYASGVNTSATISNIQIEEGSTATPYVPYFNGGTTTAEMLLKVGDYQDQQDIISGDVTRRVGVKVLDGTENWAAKDQYGRTSISVNDLYYEMPRRVKALCSHFENLHNEEAITDVTVGQFYIAPTKSIYFHISQTTTNDFKTWLADQYAAGTPVIVVYPLATPTTEQVDGQYLYTTDGVNTVSSTSSLESVTAKITYYE
jgi:hypothetical protein